MECVAKIYNIICIDIITHVKNKRNPFMNLISLTNIIVSNQVIRILCTVPYVSYFQIFPYLSRLVRGLALSRPKIIPVGHLSYGNNFKMSVWFTCYNFFFSTLKFILLFVCSRWRPPTSLLPNWYVPCLYVLFNFTRFSFITALSFYMWYNICKLISSVPLFMFLLNVIVWYDIIN